MDARARAIVLPMATTESSRPYAAIGERLRQLRRAHSQSQVAAAEAISIKQPTYNAYETGRRLIPVEHALLLRKFYKSVSGYNITLDYIYTGEHGGVELRLLDALRHKRRLP